MNFLHPGIALAGAAAVALPIVIHLLFRRRRVAVEWAAMELLREAVRRTNRRLKLEQWLVLALRSLAVLAAGLALAVPYFGGAGLLGDSAKTWIVVVDDGASSMLRAARDGEQEFARVRLRRSTRRLAAPRCSSRARSARRRPKDLWRTRRARMRMTRLPRRVRRRACASSRCGPRRNLRPMCACRASRRGRRLRVARCRCARS